MSDGKYSPKEVIDIAVKNGVKVLAIADHDTVDAYSDKLFNYAKENNLLSTIGSDFHDYNLLRPKIWLVNKKINLTE